MFLREQQVGPENNVGVHAVGAALGYSRDVAGELVMQDRKLADMSGSSPLVQRRNGLASGVFAVLGFDGDYLRKNPCFSAAARKTNSAICPPRLVSTMIGQLYLAAAWMAMVPQVSGACLPLRSSRV